jgi:putative hydrolase of the HAD superfamily
MLIKAIVFDMDDTLFQEKEYVLSGFLAVGKWLEETRNIRNFYIYAKNRFNRGERKYVFNKALEDLNISYDHAFIKKLIDVYRTHQPNIFLLEDAKHVLDTLQDSIKVGLITDGYSIAQRQKFNALGISNKFNTVIFSDEFGRENWKPSQLPYEKASYSLQCLPDECVYVGDNENKDFITAKKLGWLTVYIDRNEGIYSHVNVTDEHKAHYKINDLRELSNINELKHLFKLQTA